MIRASVKDVLLVPDANIYSSVFTVLYVVATTVRNVAVIVL